METRKGVAAAKKVSGKYNCTQSVVTSYPDITGLDESVAMSMTDGFAAGMTNMEGTCGALVGAALVLGLANKDKRKTMSQVREVMGRFQERNHAIQCKLLKGVTTHKVLRQCPFCVADACEFLEEQLDKQ
jgi:C_GCAxxG_C_C family probable redox protein